MADDSTKAPPDAPVIAALKGLPQAQVKPISGEASVSEKSGYVAELIAYAALDNALSDVAQVVESEEPTGVLIVEDRALLHSTFAYQSIAGEVTRLCQELKELLAAVAPTAAPSEDAGDAGDVAPLMIGASVAGVGMLAAPLAAGLISTLGAAPSLLGVAADVVGMFRTEYAMAGRSMSPQGTPVVAEMSRLLSRRTNAIPSTVDGFSLTDKSPLLAGIEELRSLRMAVEKDLSARRQAVLLGQVEIDAARAEIEVFRAAVVKAATADGVTSDLDARHQAAERRLAGAHRAMIPASSLVGYADKVLTAVDAFLVGVCTATKDGGDPPLLGALLREALFVEGDAEPRVSHVLFVSLDSIGVDVVDAAKRFGRNEWYSYFGGLQVSYLLLEGRSGTTVGSGTVRRLGHARFNVETGELSDHWTKPIGGPGRRESEVKDAS
jgi:hypothetical protein